MRIAIVHSFYRSGSPSGENAVVLDQVAALSEAGHEVHLVARRSDDDLSSPIYPIAAAVRTLTGWGGSPDAELSDVRPDVVHVHNLFPNFGSRWLSDWKGPLVATLHNFRPLCANGLLFRDGAVCLACPEGAPMSAVSHACYHDSRLATIPLAIRNSRGVERNDLVRRADRLVVLSELAKDVYARFGVPAAQMTVLPNGIADAGNTGREGSNGRWLYVGRLSEEKGILQLIRSWPASEHLDVVGSGHLEKDLLREAPSSVRFLGAHTRDDVRAMMADYEGLVFPSACFEMQPTVAIEAMAASLPIVALRGNAASTLVEQQRCGCVYSSPGELAVALEFTRSHRTAMGARARSMFEDSFTRSTWVRNLIRQYEQAITAYGGG